MPKHQPVLKPDIKKLVSGLSESVGGTPIEGNAPGDAGPPGQPHVQSGKVAREVADDMKLIFSKKKKLTN